MIPKLFFPTLLIWLGVTSFAPAQNAVPDTPQGFQAQYQPVYEAYRRHDDKGLERQLDRFAIPPHWFTDSFAAGQSSELTRKYEAEFAEFKKRTATNLAGIGTVLARVNLDPATPVDLRTRRWTAAESTNSLRQMPAFAGPVPLVQKFEIDYVLALPGQNGARLTSWIDSFIYVDGAFRFLGTNSRPFWVSVPAAKP